jgi:hypothetical protein
MGHSKTHTQQQKQQRRQQGGHSGTGDSQQQGGQPGTSRQQQQEDTRNPRPPVGREPDILEDQSDLDVETSRRIPRPNVDKELE